MGDSAILANGHVAHVGISAIEDANIKPTVNGVDRIDSSTEDAPGSAFSSATTMSSSNQEAVPEIHDYDMLIIGAGISGM
jgi:hypothetical protein